MSRSTKRVVVAGSIAAFALSGCYVVPVAPEAAYPAAAYPAFVVPPAPVAAAPSAPYPALLHARLYPANDIASRTGMLSGTVTNMMTGKGRFQLDYAGEVMVGEATRVAGDDHAGLANAYGQRGTFMNCRYRMSTPFQGTGTCDMSTGARYQVHIGA
jgi:hypothetical protein